MEDTNTQIIDSDTNNRPLSNHTAALVLGILSIVPGICIYGILGVILGTIALIISRDDFAKVKANAAAYNPSHVNNLKAGRVCAIIGLSLSGLYLLAVIMMFMIWGSMIMGMGGILSNIE